MTTWRSSRRRPARPRTPTGTTTSSPTGNATSRWRTETYDVNARIAVGDERERIWGTQKERFPGFAGYEQSTSRDPGRGAGTRRVTAAPPTVEVLRNDEQVSLRHLRGRRAPGHSDYRLEADRQISCTRKSAPSTAGKISRPSSSGCARRRAAMGTRWCRSPPLPLRRRVHQGARRVRGPCARSRPCSFSDGRTVTPMNELPWIISVDDHVVEPPTCVAGPAPAEDREVGPRVGAGHVPDRSYDRHDQRVRTTSRAATGRSSTGGSTRTWRRPIPQVVACAGFPFEEHTTRRRSPTPTCAPGCYDPAARLADMDINRTERSLCFPFITRFAGQLFLEAKDKDLALRCVPRTTTG